MPQNNLKKPEEVIGETETESNTPEKSLENFIPEKDSPKKQKPFYLKWLFWIPVLFLIIVASLGFLYFKFFMIARRINNFG